MLPDRTNERYVTYFQKARRRQADHFRLALIARQGQPRIRFYYPLMERVGAWLVAYGTRLQRRYGELKEVAQTSIPEPAPQAASIQTR
jgi:hypothetical protein